MMGGEVVIMVFLGVAYEDGARSFLNLKRAILKLGFEAELQR
jgi:hypothetical protein